MHCKGSCPATLSHSNSKNLFSQHMSDVGRCIFKSVNILRMKDVYTFYVCVHMFKVIKVNISPSLQSTLDLRVRDLPYDTRGGELYCVPFPRVENVRVNYKYQFIVIWNSLPPALKNINELTVFKKRLLEYLTELN